MKLKHKSILITILLLLFLLSGCSKEMSDSKKYKLAIQNYENANFDSAKKLFIELGDFKDSENYINLCDFMKDLQGEYREDGGGGFFGFTIHGFKVLDWDAGTTIAINNAGDKVFFENEKFGRSEYKLTHENSVPILTTTGKSGKLVYKKVVSRATQETTTETTEAPTLPTTTKAPETTAETTTQLTETTTEISTVAESAQEETTTDNKKSFSILHGKFLEANITEDNGIIIKAKIEPSYSNKATIHQNYFNIEDIIKKQGGSKYDYIEYWAVAEMMDGSEGKVISFTLTKELIQAIKEDIIVPIQYGDYVDNLWILSSLLE